MKRILAILLLVAAVFLGVRALDRLPADNAPEVRKKYDTWTGVLRVWVVEDWQVGTGSLERWLNICGAQFEKSHDGVYVNVQLVPAEAVKNFLTTGVNPPDLIVYPPGLLDSADGLRAFSVSADYKAGLDAVGRYEDARYAAAVLTNAYVWIYDPGRRKRLPADLYEVPAACRANDLPALVCLNSGLRPAEGTARVLPGVDIGLSGGAAETPEPTGSVACRVGADFLVSDAAWTLFQSGDVDAFVGDLSDIRRAAQRTNWATVVTGAYAWTDDMALVSLVARDGDRADERAALCEGYINLLLWDGQTRAAKAGALPVTRGAGAYAGDLALAPVEAALETMRHICAPAFGMRDDSAPTNAYVSGTITADEAIRRLQE